MTIQSVRILIGTDAYAVIKHDKGSIDVLLRPGRSAANSLTEVAREIREKIAELERRADLYEQAAGYLIAQKEIAA